MGLKKKKKAYQKITRVFIDFLKIFYGLWRLFSPHLIILLLWHLN